MPQLYIYIYIVSSTTNSQYSSCVLVMVLKLIIVSSINQSELETVCTCPTYSWIKLNNGSANMTVKLGKQVPCQPQSIQRKSYMTKQYFTLYIFYPIFLGKDC